MTMRGNLDETQARAFLVGLYGGRVETISESDRGGWDVVMEEMERCGVDVIENHDDFLYCFITITNERDDEHGDYVETIMQTREPQDGADGIIVECLYTKRLGSGSLMGVLEGRVLIVPADAWDETQRRCRTEHAQRSLLETALQLRYVSDGYRYAFNISEGEISATADTLESLSTISRVMLEGGMNAVRTP